MVSNDSQSTYTQLTQKFEGARPEKGLKIRPYSKTKLFSFEYFPKKSFRNEPFSPYLIPNTPYVIFYFILFVYSKDFVSDFDLGNKK